jgi:hypothetical protein
MAETKIWTFFYGLFFGDGVTLTLATGVTSVCRRFPPRGVYIVKVVDVDVSDPCVAAVRLPRRPTHQLHTRVACVLAQENTSSSVRSETMALIKPSCMN